MPARHTHVCMPVHTPALHSLLQAHSGLLERRTGAIAHWARPRTFTAAVALRCSMPLRLVADLAPALASALPRPPGCRGGSSATCAFTHGSQHKTASSPASGASLVRPCPANQLSGLCAYTLLTGPLTYSYKANLNPSNPSRAQDQLAQRLLDLRTPACEQDDDHVDAKLTTCKRLGR